MLPDSGKAVERYRILGLAIEAAVEMDQWDEVGSLLNERDTILTQFSKGVLHIDAPSKAQLQVCDQRLLLFMTGTRHDAIEGLRNLQEGSQLRRTYRTANAANSSFEKAS